jgi:tetratricopeptide (TPR) repeat protein
MRHPLITIGLLCGLILFALPATAQTGGARGKIVDAEGKGIPDATVVFQHLEGGGRFELRTNDKGEYIQLGLTTGSYHVTVTREGYEGKTVQARIGVGMANDIDRIELQSAQVALQQPASGEEVVREMFAKGVNLAQAGQLDEAAAIFEEIDQAHPGILEVYRNLGFISVRQENWARAEASFLAALELRPGDPDFVAALVKVYEESGQEEKARELVSQTASANPGDGTAQYNQGIFLLKEGKSEEAMGAFEAALAADPPAMEAHYYLGTLLVGQGQVPEAIEHLEAYVASEPPNPQNLATAQGLLEALKQQ